MQHFYPLPPPPAPNFPSASHIYWGASIDGDVYSIGQGDAPYLAATWNQFEANAGRAVSILHYSNPWITWDGYGTAATKVQARGAIPLITLAGTNPALSDVVAGNYDSAIDAWATAAAAFGYPLFVRPWWEMNGTWFSWGQDPNYIAAWRRLYTRVNAIANNVSFVWCPNIIGPTIPDPTTWWPGDSYVDWLGIDGYNFGTNPLQTDSWKTASTVFTATYNIITGLSSKPIIVCETASTEYGGDKAAWITDFLGTALPTLFPKIKAMVWFDDNPIQGSGRLDWPIESSTQAQTAFNSGIASSYYLAPPFLSQGTKVPGPS